MGVFWVDGQPWDVHCPKIGLWKWAVKDTALMTHMRGSELVGSYSGTGVAHDRVHICYYLRQQFSTIPKDTHLPTIGWQPAFMPLSIEALKQNRFRIDRPLLERIPEYEPLWFASLLMDGLPVRLPDDGEGHLMGEDAAADYHQISSLGFASCSDELDCYFRVIRWGEILLADRPLLVKISFNDLALQHLAQGIMNLK